MTKETVEEIRLLITNIAFSLIKGEDIYWDNVARRLRIILDTPREKGMRRT